MNGENLILFAIIGVAFLSTLGLSFFLGKSRNKLGLSILGVIWAGFTGILFFGMYNATGWDAIGNAIFLIGVSAPAGVGSLMGSLVGWAKSGNKQDEKPSQSTGHTDTAAATR